MLRHIQIRNFAIIDQLDLDFRAGMTAMTGETGAGKSILIDALGLVLGDRGNADLIRPDTDKAEILAEFQISDEPGVEEWLANHDLEEDGQCIVRRVITRDGRSRGYINGRPSPMQALRELGERLVDIHGQHAHQLLLKKPVQLDLLDAFGEHGDLRRQVRDTYREWRSVRDQLEQLRQAAIERRDRLDLLRYQHQELAALELTPEELETIGTEHSRLAHAGRILETSNELLERLYESDQGSIYGSLSDAAAQIEELGRLDSRLEPIAGMLAEAQIQVQESANELRHCAEDTEMDPARLEWLEERLATLQDLARKHHVEPEDLPRLETELADEIRSLEQADEDLDSLGAREQELLEAYRQQARELSAARQETAASLGQRVSDSMEGLGMPEGHFEIDVSADEDGEPRETGIDTVDYLVTTNPGQPARPLGKVASGGELSRISLAIRMETAFRGQVATLIFDEVDTGIGGGVAEVVGRHLGALGTKRQVLCVTHLPQVAAQAAQHLQVGKEQGSDATTTRIATLSRKQRIEELSRMLGGVEITAQTRAHAEEMLKLAGN